MYRLDQKDWKLRRRIPRECKKNSMYENELKQLIDERNRGDSLLDLKTMGTMVDFGEKSGSSQPMNGNDER